MSPQNNNLLREGDEFEKFVIERELGHGGMGAVYLVRHRVLDSEFALKVLYPEIATRDGQFVERFIREARLAGRIHHPNLIAVYDAGYNDRSGMYYLVMDYVPGVSLRKRIKQEGCIPLPEAISIIRQCADALKAAQQYNMVHRDIKPDNIMFGSHGEARLADLGIAKASGDKEANLTLEAAVFGTPSYMSPEQARDSSQVDTRADIYSLGVVLFEMLTGTRPFKGSSTVEILANVISDQPAPSVTSVKPEIPADVAKLVADMLAKPLSERIASPAALIQRIDALDMDAIEAAAQANEDEFATAPTMVDAAAAQAPHAAPIASAVPTAEGVPEVTMPTAAPPAPKASPARQVPQAKPAASVASAVPTADESPEVTMPTAAPPAPKVSPVQQVPQPRPAVPVASAVPTADDQPQVTMDMPAASVPQAPPKSSKKGKVVVILAIVLVVVLMGIGGAVFGTMKLIAHLNGQQDPNKPSSGEVVQPSPSPEKTDSPQSVQPQSPETSVTQSQPEMQATQTKTDQHVVETKTETQVISPKPQTTKAQDIETITETKTETRTIQPQPEPQQKPEPQTVQTQPEPQQKPEQQTVQTQPEPQTVQTQPEQKQKVEQQTVQPQPEQQQKPEQQTVQTQPEPQIVQPQPEQQQKVEPQIVQPQPEQQQKPEPQTVQTQPEPQTVQTQPEQKQKVEPQPVQPTPVLPVNPPQPANANVYPPGKIFLFGEDNAGTRQLLAAVRNAAPGKTVTLHKAGLSSRCRGQLSGLRSQKPDLLMVAVTSRYSSMSLANFETLVNELLDDFASQGTNFIFVLEPTAGRNSRFCSGNDVVRDACTRHGRGWLDCQADINLDLSEFLKKD